MQDNIKEIAQQKLNIPPIYLICVILFSINKCTNKTQLSEGAVIKYDCISWARFCINGL